MTKREPVRIPLPRGRIDRLLLALGTLALIAVVPMLWIWLLYGSGLSGGAIYGAYVGLSTLTAGIGLAMIRILDGIR